MLYEKPNFKGEKIALDEGDIELTYPFNPPEEQPENGERDGEEQSENGQKDGKEQTENGAEVGEEQTGETGDEQVETKPARRFIIGSVRRAVRVREAEFSVVLDLVIPVFLSTFTQQHHLASE